MSDPHGYSHRLPRSQLPISQMNLTPEEMNVYKHHLNNLTPKKWVKNKDGSTSTVYSRTELGSELGGDPNRWYVYPQVWNGQILKGDQLWDAVQPASQWPNYSSQEEADARYNELHGAMEMDMAPSEMIYGRDK